MKDVLRNGLNWLCWATFTIFACMFCIYLVMANYLGCRQSLEYQGYDQMPLIKDAYIGQIIGPFFPDMTVAHFYATGLAVGMAICLFIVFNLMFYIYKLFLERSFYISENDMIHAGRALDQIILSLPLLFVFILLSIGAIYWDIDLYRFRCTVGALGLDDPTTAPRIVENWDIQLKKYGHLAAWQLTRIGAYGYVALTGISCAAIELLGSKTGERFERLANSVALCFKNDDQLNEETLYGYDETMQPVYDPATPVAYDINGDPVQFYGYDAEGFPVYDPETPIVYDTEENLIREATDEDETTYTAEAGSSEMNDDGSEQGARNTAEAHEAHQNNFEETSSARENATHTQNTAANNGTRQSNSSLFDEEEIFQNVGNGRANQNNPLKDVIGKPGARISLVEAMAEKTRYWIDPDTLDIWDREYRRILFPETC